MSVPRRASRTLPKTASALLPVVAWCVVIFLLSAQPSPVLSEDPGLDVLFKKTGHVIVFGLTGLLVWRGLRIATRVARPGLVAVAITSVIAVADEAHQAFVPGRHAAAGDVLLDTAAAAVAIMAASWISARVRRPAPPDRGSAPNG